MRNLMTKKRILIVLALLALPLLAMQVVGYLELQLRSAPGSAASGFLRIWADSGASTVKCKTAAGAACYFDSNGGAHAIGMAFGQSGGPNLATGTTFVTMPFSCSVQSTWYTYSDQTVTFDVLKNGSTIVSGGAPSAAAGSNSGSTSGWTTSISSGDVIGWRLASVSGNPTTASIVLGCN
jgi:hypothetical protein